MNSLKHTGALFQRENGHPVVLSARSLDDVSTYMAAPERGGKTFTTPPRG